jgi:hypothetical protein
LGNRLSYTRITSLFIPLPYQAISMDKNQLAIEINPHRMSAFEVNDQSSSLIATRACTNKSDSGYKQTLQELIADCGNTDRFESFSCSYSQAQSTLVPMSLFGESTPENIINLTSHQAISKDEIDYNRLPEWNMVNVYRMPMWIKSALIMKLPRIVIQHELTHTLRFLNTGSTIPQRSQLILQEDHFCLVVRKDGQIAHASYQVYQSSEDVLYHLLYTYQQLNISSKGELFLQTSTEALRTLAEDVSKLAKTIAQFEAITITTSMNEHLKFQSLCV